MFTIARTVASIASVAIVGLSLTACGLRPLTLVAPKDGAKVVVSGIDVEIFDVGVGSPTLAQGKQDKDFYVPEQKIIERLPAKLMAAGVPARAKLVSILPGDPVPTPNQVFGATPANVVLVLRKLNSETICTTTCNTSTWYRVSLQDRQTGTEHWASRLHLGSTEHGLEINMRGIGIFVDQVVSELQKVIVVKS